MSWQLLPTGEMTLHLRINPQHPWQPYFDFPDLMVENEDERMSQGWATYRSLLKTGQWQLIPSGPGAGN
ncbi:hypothetical protein [Anthocerotibacter panamensis]|uniref:hypothetical protein n=1 Tax=Anthocerotibacter panamensis TaxID=2857077 RepID=UPI001C4038A2|nr:hypothetical protein [Anthocerotibacter panamensis]